jgi:hypothetical protein
LGEIWRRGELEMEPEETSGRIYFGRTPNWPNLKEFHQGLNIVHEQLWLLDQKQDELVALIWLIF